MTTPMVACAAALLLAAVAAPPGPRAHGQERSDRLRLELVDTALLRAPRLDESSGVAPSRRHPGVYWTINDSGNGPYLYATDSTGADLGVVRVASAVNRDWEDLAAGPCVIEPGDCLYIGDIGDNQHRRRNVVVYRLHEPELPAGSADTGRTVPLLDSLTLHYADRHHNAEGLTISRGALLIATKDEQGQPLLLRAPLEPRNYAGALERICTLRLRVAPLVGRLVTGLTASPDGATLVVRTYVSMHVFRADAGCTPLTDPRGMAIPIVESQGEAVAFEGEDRLVLTSERAGRHAILTRLRLVGLSP